MPHQQLTRKITRFTITGVINTGLYVAIAFVLIEYFNTPTVIASCIAYCAATLYSYLANTLWSFSNSIKRTNMYRFFTVSTTGMIIAILISFAAESLGLHYGIGIIVVVIVIPISTFLLHYFWTYKET
jgi:putative flippase GtrA